MAVVVDSLYWLIDTLLGLYIWVIIIGAVLSWLVAFDVVNTRNRVVYVIGDFTYRLTEPALRPIRRIVPDLGGVDISPLLLILLLFFVRRILAGFYASLVL
jgi:YggT family protein